MNEQQFDYGKFYRDIDKVRAEAEMSWAVVAYQTLLSNSTINRVMMAVRYPERPPHRFVLSTISRLASWGKLDLNQYLLPFIPTEQSLRITHHDVANDPHSEWKRYGFWAGQTGGIEYVYNIQDWHYRATIDRTGVNYDLKCYEVGDVEPFHEMVHTELKEAVLEAYVMVAYRHNHKDMVRYIEATRMAVHANSYSFPLLEQAELLEDTNDQSAT